MKYNIYLDLKRFRNLKNYYFYLPLRLLSFFFEKYKLLYIQKKFLENKHKGSIESNFYNKIYPPKVVIFNNFKINKKILSSIYKYEKNNKPKKKLNYHKNIYQSELNIFIFILKLLKITTFGG